MITIISMSSPVSELPTKVINWDKLSNNVKVLITSASHYTIRYQEINVYQKRRCILSIMGNYNDNTDTIEFINGYTKDGLLFDLEVSL